MGCLRGWTGAGGGRLEDRGGTPAWRGGPTVGNLHVNGGPLLPLSLVPQGIGMPRSRFLRNALAALLALTAVPLHAQTVRGALTEEGSGAPIPGTLVVLLDAAGTQRAGVLTDAAGRFVLQAPAPGRYTLRAERIGYATPTSGPLELAAGETQELRMSASARPTALEGLVVRGKRRCSARSGSAETAALWEEARKALRTASWTQGQRSFRYSTREYRRELDLRSLRVLRDTGTVQTSLVRIPFSSIPAEQLAAGGYYQPGAGGEYYYYAPDADVLLSDTFLDTHCFRAESGEGERSGQVGLAFEPMRSERRTDVKGVLWLDRKTSELRSLEYRYTGLEVEGPQDRVGGRVDFERLPTGAWIVRRWRIRMPRVSVRTTHTGPGMEEKRSVITGLAEAGAEVTEIRTAAGAAVRTGGQAALAGVVFDSVTGAPLRGARVFLRGTGYAAVTDTAGRFRIDALPEGVFTASFAHPRADSLGYAPPAREVRVEQGATAALYLAVPSLPAILASACADSARRAGTGVLVGYVRNTATGAPLPEARVTATWKPAGGADTTAARAATRTGPDGSYRLCSVPAGVAFRTEADFGGSSGAAADLHVAAGVPTRHDLELSWRPTVAGGVPVNASRKPVTLDPLTVTGRTISPEAREERARGSRRNLFVREELERMGPSVAHVGDVLRRVPGLRVREIVPPGGSVVIGVCVEQNHGLDDTVCDKPVQVVVNDVPTGAGTETLVSIRVDQIESLEFIPPIMAMSRYGGMGRNGVVLIHTRGYRPRGEGGRP